MFSLVKTASAKTLMVKQMPTFIAALVIAEVFYKFHSFTLECLAFLATWSLFDALLTFVVGKFKSLDCALNRHDPGD
jgi:hypothetical protein